MKFKIIHYNEMMDRIKRLELCYEKTSDQDMKAMIYDEILHLKSRAKKLEKEILTDNPEYDDFSIALDILERIKQ